VTPVAPTVTETFLPASVDATMASTLTITLGNANGFALTQSALTATLPADLEVATSAAAATTCSGGGSALTTTATTVTLSHANIPANGSCTITVPVQSATPGSYTNTLEANALSTGPAGGNADAATATLTVTAPTMSSGSATGSGNGGGGGALDWWDTMFVVGVLLAGRRQVKRRPPR
jgi:hypothetical protein